MGKMYLNIASSGLHWNKRSKIIGDYYRASSSFVCPPPPAFRFFPLFLPFLYPLILRWTLAAAAQLSSAQRSTGAE